MLLGKKLKRVIRLEGVRETATRNRYLESSHNKMLLALRNRKELNMTDISAITFLCKQTVSSCVEDLIMAGLISDRRTCGIPPQRLVSLTELGSQVAAVLNRSTDHGMKQQTAFLKELNPEDS